jgi:hypothetical protein
MAHAIWLPRISFEQPAVGVWSATATMPDGEVLTAAGSTVLKARMALDEAIRERESKAD